MTDFSRLLWYGWWGAGHLPAIEALKWLNVGASAKRFFTVARAMAQASSCGEQVVWNSARVAFYLIAPIRQSGAESVKQALSPASRALTTDWVITACPDKRTALACALSRPGNLGPAHAI